MKSGRTLTVVRGEGASPLARPDAVPRLRPGEHPLAVQTSLAQPEIRRFRARAHSAGFGADALVALLVELESLRRVVSLELLADLAQEWEARVGEVNARIPAPELRGWQRVLAGRAVPAPDDLPEVFLPLRLAVAIEPAARRDVVTAAVEATDADVQAAIALERAATAHGLVMQTFVLSALAASSSGGAAAAL